MLSRLKVCQCMASISAALLQECLDPVGLERISTLKEDGRRMHGDACMFLIRFLNSLYFITKALLVLHRIIYSHTCGPKQRNG